MCDEEKKTGWKAVAPKVVAVVLTKLITSAVEKGQLVHVLLLGCNTSKLWHALKKDLVTQKVAPDKVHACFSTCEFPSGAFPLVLYTCSTHTGAAAPAVREGRCPHTRRKLGFCWKGGHTRTSSTSTS